MSMLADFVKYIVQEWGTLAQAPLSFSAALLFVALGIWALMNWRYAGIIAHREAEISTLKTSRDDYKSRLDEANKAIKETAPKGELATKEPADFLTEKDANIIPISDVRFTVLFNRPMRATPSLRFKDPDPKSFNLSQAKLLYWSPLGFTVDFPSAVKVGMLRFDADARKGKEQTFTA